MQPERAAASTTKIATFIVEQFIFAPMFEKTLVKILEKDRERINGLEGTAASYHASVKLELYKALLSSSQQSIRVGLISNAAAIAFTSTIYFQLRIGQTERNIFFIESFPIVIKLFFFGLSSSLISALFYYISILMYRFVFINTGTATSIIHYIFVAMSYIMFMYAGYIAVESLI